MKETIATTNIPSTSHSSELPSYCEAIIVPFTLNQRDWRSNPNYVFFLFLILLKKQQKYFHILFLCHTSFSMSATENLGSRAHTSRNTYSLIPWLLLIYGNSFVSL